MAIVIGQDAPDFSLYDNDKNLVTLSALKGRNVLLLFFPLAFTSTCTKELCSVRDNLSFYNNSDATVFGISADSLHTLKKYKEEQSLNFQLLSDYNKEVSASYDTLYETFGFNMKKVPKRSAFLINKNGIIQYAEVLENAGEVPDFITINQRLASLL